MSAGTRFTLMPWELQIELENRLKLHSRIQLEPCQPNDETRPSVSDREKSNLIVGQHGAVEQIQNIDDIRVSFLLLEPKANLCVALQFNREKREFTYIFYIQSMQTICTLSLGVHKKHSTETQSPLFQLVSLPASKIRGISRTQEKKWLRISLSVTFFHALQSRVGFD